MLKMLFSLTVAVVTTSCTTATMVSSPGSSQSNYGPVNEESRGGTIKYLNQGADFVIKGRREDAYKQMYQSCNGKYKIDAEGPKAEGGVVVALSPGMNTWSDYQYWYMQFSCVE